MQQFYKIFTARFAFSTVLRFFLCLGKGAEAWERRGRRGALWNTGARRLPAVFLAFEVSEVVFDNYLRPAIHPRAIVFVSPDSF